MDRSEDDRYREMEDRSFDEWDTPRARAAIHLCVPASGVPELDAMIERARRERLTLKTWEMNPDRFETYEEYIQEANRVLAVLDADAEKGADNA